MTYAEKVELAIKARRVVTSCVTLPQLDVAQRYVGRVIVLRNVVGSLGNDLMKAVSTKERELEKQNESN